MPPCPKARLNEVLERWFAAREAGDVIDLADLCDGDDALLARAEAALDEEDVLFDLIRDKGLLEARRRPGAASGTTS